MKILLALCLASLVPIESTAKNHHKKHHTPGEMNKEFTSPALDVEKWKQNFSQQDRDVVKFKDQIIKHLNLRQGEYVADVGAGTGLFVSDLSLAVGPSGKVYAVEISPKFVEELKKLKHDNLEVVLSTATATNLKPDSIHTLLLVDTYHHFDDANKMLLDFSKVIKTGGKLVVVDFNKTPGARAWIHDHIKLTKEEYIAEIEAQGFKLLEEAKIPMKENFMLIFNKK